MIAGIAAIIGMAVIVNVRKPQDDNGDNGGTVEQGQPTQEQELLPCNSPTLKRVFARAINRLPGVPPTADANETKFTELKGAVQLGLASVELAVPEIDLRLCDTGYWVIAEYRNGNRLEAAILNPNNADLLAKFPITP